MEDEERQRKLEAGREKLAQYRQRKAHREGQNSKKEKKKKNSSYKQDVHSLKINGQNDMSINSSQCIESAGSPDSTKVRTLPSGKIEKHDQVFIKEEENSSKQGAQFSQTHLKMMGDELAGKQHEIEELTQELEEMRATHGTEVLQQLQEFEAAVKQRDSIITQLIANLQQARKDKDETMKEFLDLTEQSKTLHIQFQHLQASEALRRNTHNSTTVELFQVKQQLEQQDHLLKDYHKREEEFKKQITFLQEEIKIYEMEQDRKEKSNEIQKKQEIIEAMNTRIIEEEKITIALRNKVVTLDKLVEDLKEQLTGKNRETKNLKLELTNSKEKEKQCSLEIKQLMETVEELQKKNYKDNLETALVQRREEETQKKLGHLRAELDEMYGKQIVEMKKELMKQYMSQMEDLKSQHKGEMENTLKLYADAAANEAQLKLMNVEVNELNIKLQDTVSQKEKLREELCVVKGEKCALQSQFNDLSDEVRFLRGQTQRARQTITEQESKLNDAQKFLSMVEDLKAEIAALSESRKDLELKHEAEITNYQIKLDMLEKEKDAVLDRMAESQEAELERLRTQLLFSHEEELCKLKSDLEVEYQINIKKLKDNLGIHHKQQIDGLQNEMREKIETMQYEKDNLITKQNQLILEISKLRDLQESHINSKSEEMAEINELKKEIEVLRQEEKEKGTFEQEIQELQLKTELLEKQLKEKEEGFQEKCSQLEAEKSILKDEKKALEDMLKFYTSTDQEERSVAVDSSEYTSKNCNWQKEIDILTKEKEDLKQQCINLSKEIEKQRNTFSFAEKNFEVNYQELREEYACLLKVRDNLEDIQTKQVLEYESKLKVLTDKLHMQKGSPRMQKEKRLEFVDDRCCITEPSEVNEVIEKDAIEIMEKLRVTEKEKLELSEKLDLLVKELQQKHTEVDSLTAEVQILNQDKEQLLLRCRELEAPTSPKGTENASLCPAQFSSWKAGLGTMVDSHSEEYESKISEDLPEESKVMIRNEISFKESEREELIQPTRTETSHALVEPCENEKLQHELNDLKSKQDDLRLQMEAQRICLSLVYSTHADVVREYMEKKKEEALCSLKDELIFAQQEKIEEINKMHQCQLQALQTQETGDEKEPLQVLIGRLQKAVSEECTYISKTLNSFLDEHYTPLKCEMNMEENDNFAVYNHNRRLNLQEYRYQVQDFQDNMQTLLSKVTDEFSKLVVLQTQLSKIHGQQTDDVKLEFTEENVAREEAGLLSITSQADLQNTGAEKIKECEEQVQGLESLVSTVQQQPKDTEMHYGAEVQYLQGELLTTHEITVQPSLCPDSVVLKESDVQEAVDCGNCLNDHLTRSIEFPGEFGGIKETKMVKLMDKQYKERLEEEIAKVIVSMSIAFAQHTEFSRISERKENSIQSEQAQGLRWQEHSFNDITSRNQVDPHTFMGTDKNFKEQSKPLSEELEEHIKKVPLSNHDDLDDDILKSKDLGLTISQEIFSKDETLTLRQCIHDEVSIMETSRQLEDMRQELVRQYEEHQQATELLRQSHMQQMERQQEDQEQLREEIKRLNAQLAQRSSINTENMVTEREMVLLEELEALKQLSLAGREELCCELQSSSTQTQDGNDNEEVEEHAVKEKTLERKPEEPILDINLSNERNALQKTNNRLLKILLEVAKTTAAAEETIGCHVVGILDSSSKGQPATSLLWRSEADISTKLYVQEEYGRDELVSSFPGSAVTENDSKWSKATEKGAEVSQNFGTSGFAASEVDCENVELMFNVSSRLQAAVEKLLGIISETSSQLEHAKVTQSQLMHESFRQKQEAAESLRCLEELHERLQEESRAREQLAVELSKAECIIDGYSDEKIIFEREIQEKNFIIDRLEQELLCTSTRLQDLEAEHQQVQEEQELLSRQKAAMRAVAGPVEHQFLQETEKLMKEKLEVQCQAEKVRNGLQKQLKILEIDVEEKTSKLIEMEQEKNAEITDLRQQNQALDKQLEKIRRFIDEQTADREHERDIFQLEIQKLEQQLKVVPRLQPGSEQQTREVEELTNHLKEKSDKCCELLLCKEQLQRDVQERDEEIEKLECRVGELEQALLINADSFPKVNSQKQSGDIEVKSELSLEVQLQAERDAIDRKEREISNLEEQLEQFREELENKNDEVQELHMQLEIQRKESTTRLQEIQQENNMFKDEMKKLEFVLQEYNPVFTDNQPMLLGKFTQIIQEKDDKIDQLNEQITKLKQEFKLAIDNKDIEEKNELIRGLETQNECLMIDQELAKKNREEEIEKLKVLIESLQKELASIKQKTTDDSTIPKDEDSLKHQLDKVISEKMALEQKVETTSEEMAYTKNILEEANFKVDQLTEELCTLRKEHENKKELQTVPEESVGMVVNELNSDILQPDVPAQDSSKSLKNQTSLRCPKENTNAYRCLETRLLLLESSVNTKDLELTQCYKQIKTMQEQGQSEAEMLQKKITNLEKLLQEKSAAAIVSHALLEAFQHYVNYYQKNQTVSSECERTDRQKVIHLTGNNVELDVSTLTVQMTELESQVAEMHSSFISEKQQVEIEEKASEKKNGLEPQKSLEENTRNSQEGKDSKISKTKAELIFASGDPGFLDELEALGEQLMSHKELARCKERAEKSEDLLASSIPGLTYSNIRQTNEICSSDSESDLGQGFDMTSEGQEESGTGIVPKVVKGLLRAVHTEGIQMLSMADSPDDGEGQFEQQISESWLEERKAYLSTISSLKDLISKMQVQRQTESIECQTTMEFLQKADRRNLLAENQALHGQINGREVSGNKEQETDISSQEFLDCGMQKSSVRGMQDQPSGMKDRIPALQEQLISETVTISELKNELSQTKLELETVLKIQRSQLKELEVYRLEVKDKTDKVHLLTDTLAMEKKKTQDLQCALEIEKARSGHQEEQDKELKDLRVSLEDQKQRNAHLDVLLGQQKQLFSELQQKIESQRILYDVQLSEEQARNLKLQVLLESEENRNQEMKYTLDKERELHAQLQSSGDGRQPRPVFPPEELLQDLQKQLEEKQKHIIELVDEIQKYKLDSMKTKYQMEKDRQTHERTLKMEKEANTLGQRKMEELQSKVEELQHQLQEKSLQVYNLDLEGKRLQGIMQEFQMQELEQEERQRSRPLVYQNINEQATWNFTDDRTRNWVLQQKMEEEAKDMSYATLIEMNGGKSIYDNDVGVIKQKLQHVAIKLQHVAQKACNRLEFEVSDKDALIWVRGRIDRIIFRLQRLIRQPDNEHNLGPFSTSCGSLTETLLKQIFELTGHINQLTEEKKDLQKIIMKLEEQIKFYQQTRAGISDSSGFSLDGGANIEDIIASEKEVWSKEKLTLQQSLKKAEAKICELKAELLHQNQSPDSDNAVFKRLYGKYLRAESFRKALVFQKKYLLLLLGQFQECEDATMGLLARMAGCTDLRNPETVTRSPKGFTRFRIAIRVSVAITRMKFLVRRWHRLKSSSPIIVNRDGFEFSPGIEKTDQLYHSTSGLELYGEPRQMTYRSRSDLEIPRFPLPFNRYPGTPADLNPETLTYGPLQQYNPGRTLTDYVTQMEALQRRLGRTLQPGSPSFQSHPGMRK